VGCSDPEDGESKLLRYVATTYKLTQHHKTEDSLAYNSHQSII